MKVEILDQQTNMYVDITKYIKFGGVKWQRSDIDSPDAGRTLDGLMHRGRVATKIRLDINCRPLKTEEIKVVLNLIYPQYITVRYTDPMAGGLVEKSMYSNNNPATFMMLRPNGDSWWSEISFPLIEQ